MNRHTPSFFVSVLVHVAFAAIIFFLYKTAVILNAKKEENKVCIHLQTLQKAKPLVKLEKTKPLKKNPIPKKVSKPKPQVIKKEKKVIKKVKPLQEKKIQEEVKPKIVPALEEETEVEIVEEMIQKAPPKEIKQEKLLAPPEPIIPLSKPTVEELYIDKNLQKISELLSENLYYPRRARKRGIEGVVNVDFTLDTDAVVSDIDVVSSSDDILSRAAIKTLEDLSGEFPRPKEILRLSVPIHYSITQE